MTKQGKGAEGEPAKKWPIYMKPAFKAAIKAAADRQGVTLAEWVRASCQARLDLLAGLVDARGAGRRTPK